MSIELSIPRSEWVVLPAAFPDGRHRSPEAWENGIVEEFRERWGDNLDARMERYLRAALQSGRQKIRETDSLTLQYWPVIGIAHAVVHVSHLRVEDAAVTRDAYLAQVRRVGPSTTVVGTASERLGEGIEVRFAVPIDIASDSPEDAGSPVVLAGLTRVFADEDSLVMAQVEPTLPHLIPLIEGALDELLDSAVVRVEHREWRSAGVEPRLLAERAESWDLQRAAVADR